jgi:two-component system chemotaxis sensor kinase CheA
VDLKDRAQQISANVVELREATGDGPRTRQLIDSLFRTVHSYKAAASAAGFTEQSRTAHEFEDLLHNLRTGKIALDDDVLRVCDETAAALLNGSSTSSLTHLNELARVDSRDNRDLPPEFSALKEEERHRARAAMQEGANLYVLEAAFTIADFDERLHQLKEQLNRSAEVISASPTMEEDNVIFKIFYAAKFEKIRVQNIFDSAILAGKKIAKQLEKNVTFLIMGEELLIDRSLRNILEDALLHLVRNAVGHGIETSGRVTLQVLTKPKIRILVTDNGRGIDPADLPLVFQPGFSTATEVSEISGRGVGLDAVKTEIEAVGGTVNVISAPGKFTSFVITLPNPSSDA